MKNFFPQMKEWFRALLKGPFRSSVFFWCSASFVGVIGLFGWWKWVVSPLWEIEARDGYSLSFYEERVRILKNEMSQRKTLLAEVDTLQEEDWNRLDFFLPQESDFSTLLLELSSMAEAHSLTLESIDFSFPSEGTNEIRSTIGEKGNLPLVGKFQIDLTLAGEEGYESWKELIESFEHSLRFLTLSRFSYEPGVSQFDFHLEGYWFLTENAKDFSPLFLKDTVAWKNTLLLFSSKDFQELERWSRPEYINQAPGVFVRSLSPRSPEELLTYDPGIGNMIILSWKELGDDISRIHIFRSTNPLLSPKEIANVPANVQYFIDREVENGVVYYYELRSKSEDGVSSAGGEKVLGKSSDRTPPLPVLGLEFDTSESGVILIRWKNPPNKDFDFVNMYRSENPGFRGERIATKIKNGQYRDETLPAGKTYYYFLSSVDTSGNESEEVPLSKLLEKSLPFE